MKKLSGCLLLILLGAALGHAQVTSTPAAEPLAYKAGGIPIIIPPPTPDMVEVGDEKREIMEIFVPASNRLIAAFALTDEMPRFSQSGFVLSRYALVEVLRVGDYKDFAPGDFKAVVDTVKTQFGDIAETSRKDIEEDFNLRIKELHLDAGSMSIGKPIQLGPILSKPDAYGFAMILPYSMAGNTTTMAGGVALMRVKKRLLFVYLYAQYKDEETLKWLRATTTEWVDAIFSANP